MWAISVVCFLIIQMPQVDYVDVYIERIFEDHQQFITEEEAEALREFYGLDRPVFWQYWNWLGNLMVGNFGYSFDLQLPVRHLIANRLVLTIALTGMTILTTWVFSLPVGIYSALRQHSVGDYAVSFLGFLGLAVPDFLLALVLMFVAFKYFGVSVGGLFSDEYIQGALPGELQWMGWSFQRIWNMLTHLWIPAIVLGTHGTAGLIRIMRNNLLDELGKPYVVTARAKGVGRMRTILKYPVRVALNPLISTIGYLLPALVSGSVIVSVVLSLPTIGPVLLTAIQDEDIYLAGFVVLLIGMLTVFGTLLSDILLAVIDPRIKFSGN
jgi:peptide/nickel transport system permease protein